MEALRAGLVFRGPKPLETLATIKRAEQEGLSSVWTTIPGAGPDGVTLFAAAAVQTSRIVLGTSIVPTYPRHPVALASQALVMGAVAPGRFRLGIGPSHRTTIEGALGLSMGKPLEHLREYLTILRSLLWEGGVDFQGTYYQVRTRLQPGAEAPRTPLLISALRSGAFHLAGELADGAISWMCPVPYLVGTARTALQAGAGAAGRPVPPLVGHVPVALHPDREAVRAAARQQLGSYGRQPFYQAMFAEAGFPVSPDGVMSDQLFDELVVSGTPEQVIARLRDILAAGVDEILITPVTVQDAEAEVGALVRLLARAG